MNRCLKEKLNRKIYPEFVNPRVSVIIPVYNCQNSIKQAIRSIQYQKMIDIEIILVNDKSNDESIKIIQKFQKTDKRIKLINNKKYGNIILKKYRCFAIKREIHFSFR